MGAAAAGRMESPSQARSLVETECRGAIDIQILTDLGGVFHPHGAPEMPTEFQRMPIAQSPNPGNPAQKYVCSPP